MPDTDYILDLQNSNRKTPSPLAVTSKSATHGSHYSHWGIGGYVELPSIEYRNAIPSNDSISEDLFSSGRRKVGMIVYVISENKYYQLIPREINETDPTKPGEPVSLSKWLFYRSAKKTILLNPEKQDLDDFDDGAVVDELGEFGNAGDVNFATYDIISGSGDPNHCWTEVFVKGNFQTLIDLESYIESNTSAYAGQICSVIEDKKVYLVINGATAGALTLQEIGTGGGGGEVFDDDFQVSIAAGKTFGKYANGDWVLAKNKTPKEVIIMACLEALSPTLNIFSGDVIDFGESGNKTLEIEFDYTIRTKNATVSSIKIEKKKGASSSWTTPADVTTLLNWSSSASPATNPPSSPISDTFSHAKYDTTSLYYKLTVTDSGGGTNSIIYTFNPSPYLAPSIGSNSIGTVSRYRGDSNTTYVGTINKRSDLVSIVSYKLQRKIDSGNWTDLTSYNVTGNPSSISVSSSETEPGNSSVKNAGSIAYRIAVIDEYTQSNSSQTELGALTITFYHKCGVLYSSSATINISAIDSATEMVLQDTKARTITGVTANGMYTYYVYKSSAGNLANIVQDDALSVSSTWVKQSNIEGLNINGATVSYAVYRSSVPGAYTNKKLAFT